MNRTAIAAIYRNEMARFFRTLAQSFFSPVLSASLYFVVFGAAIGSRIDAVEGVSYGAFIVPGLVMLTVMTQGISNASFGIYFPKFIGTIYILHDILPVLSQLSKRFQRGNVNFSHLLPAIKATHAKINRLKEGKECLKKLQNDLAQNGRLNRCGLTLSDNKMQEPCSLMNCYIVALQDNINNRFEPTLPQVSAFSIVDIADLPNESDPGFEAYGQAEIKIISNHFYGTKEEEEKKMKSAKLLAQWKNFKFEMVAWKKQVPQTLLQPNDRSPEDTNILTTTDWTLP